MESFWSGRAAMVPFWHGMDMTFAQNPDMIENVGVVPMPAGDMRVTEQGGRYISVFASSEAPEAAKAWVEFLFTPDNARALTEVQPMLYPPVTTASMEALHDSEAPTFQAYGDQLFDIVYANADIAYNQIFNGGGIDPANCTMNETGNLNPFVSVVWNSNLYARGAAGRLCRRGPGGSCRGGAPSSDRAGRGRPVRVAGLTRETIREAGRRPGSPNAFEQGTQA
jgi:hypothetical protein